MTSWMSCCLLLVLMLCQEALAHAPAPHENCEAADSTLLRGYGDGEEDGPFEDPIYFRDMHDCATFYQCSNGLAYQFYCPCGLVFDLDLNVCSNPEDTDCSDITPAAPDTPNLPDFPFLDPPVEGYPAGLGGEPLAPVGPVGPEAPVGPVAPEAPVGPVAPEAPVGPVAPLKPVAAVEVVNPVGPVEVAKPVGPVAPVGPVTPVEPVKPVAAVEAPGGPVGPAITAATLCINESSGKLFPHPTNCTKYFRCSRQKAVEQVCSWRRHFNPIAERCQSPRVAGCQEFYRFNFTEFF